MYEFYEIKLRTKVSVITVCGLMQQRKAERFEAGILQRESGIELLCSEKTNAYTSKCARCVPSDVKSQCPPPSTLRFGQNILNKIFWQIVREVIDESQMSPTKTTRGTKV